MQNVAEQFAELLDATRFDEVVPLLAENCEYHYWEGDYIGNRNIVTLYRHNHSLSDKLFDEVRYFSEVEQTSPDTFVVKFTDRLRVGNRWHEHHFENVLHVEDGTIVDILHRDLPGQKEAYFEFYESVRPRIAA